MDHLVYCDAKSKVLDKIVNKSKTMIIRGAAGRKLPHSRVFENDTLYFIENNGSGVINYKAKVKSVFNSEKMSEDVSKELVASKQDLLNLSDAQIERWAGKKVLCLIEFIDVEQIDTMYLNHQKNMDDWIAVEDIKTILEGTSEKYNSIRI